MKKIVGLFIFLVSSVVCFGQTYQFKETQNISKAYQEIISFKLASGRTLLYQEVRSNPSNAFILLMQNYEDFISLCFDDDPAQYKIRKVNKDKRLDLLNNADKNSPYYLLSKGIIHLQWSMIHIKYREFLSAVMDFKKAYGYFRDNKKQFPSFKENDIYFGTQQAVIGTIPDNYKWITNTLGLKGSIKNGMHLLARSIKQNDDLFQADAKFNYIYLTDILLNDSRKALALIESYNLDTRNVYLFTFTKANLQLNNFQAQRSLQTLDACNTSSAYIKPQVFEYERGSAELLLGNYSNAITYLKRFLTSKSYFYKKDACLKIAYAYYLLGQTSNANIYKQKIKTNGTSDSDLDKQAQQFSKSEGFDHPKLLKARLLFDGGQFEKSISILENEAELNLSSPGDQIERIYRLARNYDEDRQTNKAIEMYKKTMTMPNPDKDYFPARAALQLGFIYEEQGQSNLAMSYYKKVLAYQDHDFKSSLDHRAKSGILRLTGK